MTIPHDRRSDVFTDWLDAQVTGTSTPDHELAADRDLADLCAAADQFHGLDQRLGQYATRVLPSTQSWEDIMSTNANAIATSVGSQTPQSPSASRQAAPYRAAAWDRFASGVLTAAVVIALVAGAWRVGDWSPFGGGSEPPTAISFGGFGPENDNQNDRLVPIATVGADEQMSSIPYPTAAECTVEPPTREWVVDHLEQANVATQGRIEFYGQPIEPSSEDVNAIMATFRMWQACQIGNRPASYWMTLQTPWFTQNHEFFAGWNGWPVDDEQLEFLTDLAMAGSEDRTSTIDEANQSDLDSSTPMGTPMGEPVLAIIPFPIGATPVAQPATENRGGLTIFADNIQIIGPNRAYAHVYWVNAESGEITFAGDNYAVQFVFMDGKWLINYHESPGRG